tara:strand:- start:699 stop:920 length:222 start_codon:yes stop_codon:yes gene_type:complete
MSDEMNDEYYDQDGHQYALTEAEEDAWQEESYQEGLLSELANSIKGDDYPISIQLDKLEPAFKSRGYKIVLDI